jgi:hypothetical protein
MSTVNNGPQIVRSGLVLDLDASYMRSYSPNVYPNPTDLLATQYMGNEIQSCTVSRDTTITRQYGSIPMKMVITGNDAYAGRYGYAAANLASALSGQTWTISVWAKASVATSGELFIFGADTNGAVFVSPDYSAAAITITTSWQRFSFSYTFTNASTRYIQFRLDGTNTGGSGITIWWDGLQIERASSATTFNPYYFGDTVWKDVSGNGRNGTLTSGPLFNTSNKGNILFDGANDYVSIPDINFTAATIDIWVYINAYDVGGSVFVYQSGNGFELWSDFNGLIRYNKNPNAGLTSGPGFTLNSWNNIVATSDGTINKLYLNNVNIGSTNGVIFDNTAGDIRISGYGSYMVNGKCAMLKMYNRALSVTEITQNYEATKTRFGL